MNKALLLLAVLAAGAVALLFSHPEVGGAQGPPPVQAAPPKRPSEEFFPLIKSIYGKLDKGKNGYITRADIDRAVLADHSIKDREAEALYALRSNFQDFATTPAATAMDPRPVSRVSLTAIEAVHNSGKPADVLKRIDESMEHARKFLSRVNRDLYPKGKESESLARMRHVYQAGRGNCYLLSGLISQAAVDPASVRKIIKDNGVNKNGVRTYTVTFPYAAAEPLTVEEFTDCALLINEVHEEHGTWLALLVRAYGQYLRAHEDVRFWQRLWYRLDERILPEDLTDEGSMGSDGLRLFSEPGKTRVKQIVWGFDDEHVRHVMRELIAGAVQRSMLFPGETLDPGNLGNLPQFVQKYLIKRFTKPRDEAQVHEQLKHSLVDNKLPATVYKSGGAHEASIIGYVPGTKTADGKHTSKWGFITIRDQAGLDGDEQAKLKSGTYWREPGMDDNTYCLTVEDFTKTFSGFSSVIKVQ